MSVLSVVRRVCITAFVLDVNWMNSGDSLTVCMQNVTGGLVTAQRSDLRNHLGRGTPMFSYTGLRNSSMLHYHQLSIILSHKGD